MDPVITSMEDTSIDELILMMEWLETLHTTPRLDGLDPQIQEAAQTLIDISRAGGPSTAALSCTSRPSQENEVGATTAREDDVSFQQKRDVKQDALFQEGTTEASGGTTKSAINKDYFHPRLSLLGLPAELRNAIFSHALPEKGEIQEFRLMFSVYPPVPPILQVCRQIRNETLLAYYTNATFELMTHWKSTRPLAQWLRSVDPAARRSLYMNSSFNVRVIADSYHPDFSSFESRLGHYWLADPDECGLLILAHKAEHERQPIAQLRSGAKCRRERMEKKAYERSVENGNEGEEARERLEKRRRKRKEDVGRRKLKEVLLGVWDRVEEVLVGKKSDEEKRDDEIEAGA